MIRLIAPAGSLGTTIMASASGKNYSVDETGMVDVDQRDVLDLMRAGYSIAVMPTPADPVPEVSADADAARVLSASKAALALHA